MFFLSNFKVKETHNIDTNKISDALLPHFALTFDCSKIFIVQFVQSHLCRLRLT